jgi:hypothetical protein
VLLTGHFTQIPLGEAYLPPLSLTGYYDLGDFVTPAYQRRRRGVHGQRPPDGGEPAPIPLACICVLKPSAPIKYDLMQILLEGLHMQFFSSVAEQRWV